jgi:hypothetical protein
MHIAISKDPTVLAGDYNAPCPPMPTSPRLESSRLEAYANWPCREGMVHTQAKIRAKRKIKWIDIGRSADPSRLAIE